jgi:hypothetical protein
VPPIGIVIPSEAQSPCVGGVGAFFAETPFSASMPPLQKLLTETSIRKTFFISRHVIEKMSKLLRKFVRENESVLQWSTKTKTLQIIMASTSKQTEPATLHQQCPKCGGTAFDEPCAGYWGRTIKWQNVTYEHGSVLARCTKCRLPVPQQIQATG